MSKLTVLASMLATVFSLTMLTACSDKEEVPYIKSSDAGTTITAEGSSWAGWSTVIQSNIDQSGIQTTSSASWCAARLMVSGNNTYQLQVSAEDNPTLSSRQAIVTVKAVEGQAVVTFMVSQQPGKPYISFKDGGGDVTIESQAKAWERIIESNIDFSKLIVMSSGRWCSAKLESNGGNIILKLDAPENKTFEERKTTITIRAASGSVETSFVVTQQAATPSISFVEGGEDQTVTPDAKNWTWEVLSNISYSELLASSDADWCTVELTQATSTKKISLSVKVAKNETVSERKAVVTVKSTKYGTEAKFTVTQQPFGPSLVFTAGGTDQTISPDGKNWTWELSTNLKKDDLTVTSTADWCTVELTGSDSKGISLSVKVAKNESISERKAVVTVKSTRYDVSLSFNVTQQAGQPTIKFNSSTEGNDQTVTAVAKELVWTMQSNIPYGDLKVSSNENWCQVKLADSKDATDMKSFQLTINIAENPTDKQRQAVVTISSEKHIVSKSFMMTQSAAIFNSSHPSLGFDRDGGNRTVTITSNASWKAECDADWVTLEQTNGYLTVRVKATTADRKATITFKDKTSTTITVNQTKYKVGEEYNEGGVTGTVAYIGDDKRFIYKNTGKSECWMNNAMTLTSYNWSMDDGEHNMQIIKQLPSWYSHYMAFVAADNLNTGGVTGWYLPAVEELRNMKAFVSGSAWSSTHLKNDVIVAYALVNGTISFWNTGITYGVYAIRKF